MLKPALAAALAVGALLQALPALAPALAQGRALAIAPAAIPQDEEAARRALAALLDEAMAGEVRLARFTPDLARQVEVQASGVVALLHGLGPLRSLVPLGSLPGIGLHQFEARHARGTLVWAVSVEADGRIANLMMERR